MIKGAVIVGLFTVGGGKTFLLPDKTGFSALAELHQNQGNRAICPMAQKKQPFCFQFMLSAAGAQLRESLRTVDDEKITAVPKRPACGRKQLGKGTTVLPTGKGGLLALRAGGKIGGIGNTARKTSGGENFRNVSDIAAYTIKTVGDTVGRCVVQRHLVGAFG